MHTHAYMHAYASMHPYIPISIDVRGPRTKTNVAKLRFKFVYSLRERKFGGGERRRKTARQQCTQFGSASAMYNSYIWYPHVYKWQWIVYMLCQISLVMCACEKTKVCVEVGGGAHIFALAMGWLWSVGSLNLYVSFAKEPYKTDHILQNRPEILRSLLIGATPYPHSSKFFLSQQRLAEHRVWRRLIGSLIFIGHFFAKVTYI